MRRHTIAHTLLVTPPTACEICGRADPALVGEKDFGVSGNDHFEGHRVFEDYGAQIPYYECRTCGFVFANAFDRWTTDQWQEHVYNNQYALADPPFLSERPVRNAQMIAGLFHRCLNEISILDVGGGNGLMAEELRERGVDIQSHDPIFSSATPPNDRCFDLITSFEVMEHVTHQRQRGWLEMLAALLRRTTSARILLSTEVIWPSLSLDWWYICPRNGHISIHSVRSLELLAAAVGLRLFSINRGMHLLAWKR